jgi:chemotaxis protein MotB
MLLMFTFLLSVFVLAQFFLSRDVTGKDTALQRLNRQIEELTSLLALERSAKSDAQASLSSLTVTLEQTRKDKAELQNLLDQSNAGLSGAGSQAAQANKALDAEKQVSARALAQIDILNQQIAALRRQLSAIEDALAASESRDRESQAKIADLGSRLNVALAQKVQDRSRARNSNRDPVGVARRRSHRQTADPVAAISVELGPVSRARDRRRAISDLERRQSAASRCRRLRRVPAARYG